MPRAIYCEEHGKFKPTHLEDAARGLFQRYTRGVALHSMCCDLCGVEIPVGTNAVAWCQPATMKKWEHEYLQDVA